jgi:Family of unknown function (DUF6236)
MKVRNAHPPLRTPALYYPYTDFQSEEWVKLALINWWRVERIKPIAYPYADRASTKRLSNSGWREDITPDWHQLNIVSLEFRDYIHYNGNNLRARYSVSQRDGWPKANFGVTPEGADERLAYVYAGNVSSPESSKVAASLIEWFSSEGLASIYEAGQSIWLGLHPQLATVYMCTLTNVLADDRQLVPVTDDETVHHAAARFTLDRLDEALTRGLKMPRKPSPEEIESQYFEIAVRSVLNPVNLDSISIDRVLEFRGTHETELQAFQDHIFDLRDEVLKVCRIRDNREVQHRLRDLYKSRTEPELKDLQEKLHRFGIRSVPGFLELRIDKQTAIQAIGGMATAAGAHFLLGPAAPVAVPFAISVVAIPYIKDRRQSWINLKYKSPASFLLAVKRELATSNP